MNLHEQHNSSHPDAPAHSTRDHRFTGRACLHLDAGAVYLTFDDGPSYTWTPAVLAVLREYGVHAVFFEVGENITWYPSITRNLRYYGNLIGNHTWNHPNLTTLSDYWVTWQLNRMEQAETVRRRWPHWTCSSPGSGLAASSSVSWPADRGEAVGQPHPLSTCERAATRR